MGMDLPAGLRTWLAETVERLAATLDDGARHAALVAAAVERTVERAMTRLPDGTVHVETGDIPAMWLRDSAAQARPLVASARAHPDVAELLVAIARRQLRCIAVDPRANAFNRLGDGAAERRDFAGQDRRVWERKYEVDSLAWAMDLSLRLWRDAGVTAHLDEEWRKAAGLVLSLWELETDHRRSEYRFIRTGVPARDTLSHGGYGAPVGPTGMTWSGFRPSDDACRYGYLVPANAFAAVACDGIAAIAGSVLHDPTLAQRATTLAGRVRAGIEKHGIVAAPPGSPVEGRSIYAYEVDGLGGTLLEDDANVPSLLSLPYIGFCAPDDPVYLATRAHVRSAANPRFAAGRLAIGIGSIHTPARYVWPLSIAIEGLTAIDPADARACLQQLAATTGGTDRMHESFDPDDPSRFTRGWFSWADMAYVELAIAVADAPRPEPEPAAEVRETTGSEDGVAPSRRRPRSPG
jgi:meiotically up-regulated gene 157 (Mug157) protein